MEELHHERQNYQKFELLESSVKENPMEQFRDWFLQAKESKLITEANAMSLSTIEKDGCPRTRMVLLKSYSYNGFIFYTNYKSKKGISIELNPKVCLHFFWGALERQIIIKANVEKIPENLSDGYFSQRPKGSRLSTWVSMQSSIIQDKDFLNQKMTELEKKYKDTDEIPRPDYWGGYLAIPYEFEFWQGRPNRLHDRILYQLNDDFSWEIKRLAP